MSTTTLVKESSQATHDIYTPVHKGLRLALSTLLTRLGSSTFEVGDATDRLMADLRAQLALGLSHLKHEETHVHPALQERRPGAADTLERTHGSLEAAVRELEGMIADVEAAAPADRAKRGHALYLAFSAYVAAELDHMAEEELATLPVLQQLFNDEELMAIEERIVTSVPPEDLMAFMHIMIPAMSRNERAQFLGGIKAKAPAELLDAIMENAARPTLPTDDFRDLKTRLGG